jgi:phospholipid/cholesterol/gamma-HCH transport system ATP-binding protein
VEHIVEFHNVTKYFAKHRVLNDISCKVATGKITVLIGPSGTGKSVLIKHLVGLLQPDTGHVLVDGIDLGSLSEKELYQIRRKFGMAFQDGALFDSMTVGDNLAFPLRQHSRKTKSEIRDAVASLLSQVGLPGIEKKWPSELSGGMRKRVGLARAIALHPKIVIFDEPTSGLDPVMADAIDTLILKMRNTLGITFIVISHDIESTWKIADHVGMLYKGTLIEFGSKQEIKNSKNAILQQFFSRSSEGPIKLV